MLIEHSDWPRCLLKIPHSNFPISSSSHGFIPLSRHLTDNTPCSSPTRPRWRSIGLGTQGQVDTHHSTLSCLSKSCIQWHTTSILLLQTNLSCHALRVHASSHASPPSATRIPPSFVTLAFSCFQAVLLTSLETARATRLLSSPQCFALRFFQSMSSIQQV